jgi:FkbM family methyltransferase
VLARLKYSMAEAIKKNPRTWSWVWNTLPRLTFLLPHDKTYYGFRHLAKKKDGLFLDVGANNGMTAAGFRHLNATYQIFSIEANRHHEPALRSLKGRIRNFDYTISAVGRVEGELHLITPTYKGIPIHTHTSSSRDYLDVSLRRDFTAKVVDRIVYDEQVVNTVTIDSLNLNPDIVKIDVEGGDYEVLLGMTQTIRRCRPFIMVEFTPKKTGAMAEFFAEHAYRVFVFNEEQDRFAPFIESRETQVWAESGLQVNLFAIPAEARGIAGCDAL